MATLPEPVKRWLDEGGAVELVVVDLARAVMRVAVVAEYDGDDLVMAVPEGGAVHHALIYDPQATVVISAPAAVGVVVRGEAEVRGEVEMTTAGAGELRARTTEAGDGAAGPSNGALSDRDGWLVVRVVPTHVAFRG